MYLYFLLIRIAALLGHKKAGLMVRGQKEQKPLLSGKNALPKGAIWIHAASVGEFEQARPLIERIRKEKPAQKIILTFFSPSGYELRKDYEEVDKVLYLPFATRRNAKRFLDAIQPKMAIFVKYEFWPAYLRELKKRQIPTYLISAIFRPGQLFFKPWGKAHLRLLNCFTHIFVQNEASCRLLQEHAITHVTIAGDTRFDRVAEHKEAEERKPSPEKEQDARLAPIRHFTDGCERVIVAGSTWPEDEKLLKRFITSCAAENGNKVRLILVPHEIDEEHLHFIFQLFKGRILRYSVLSGPLNSGLINSTDTEDLRVPKPDVLLVDSIGLLASIYPLGHVAYIGGGFGAGIHNTIEAAVHNMPVVFGPNYHHFREAEGLINAGGARAITNYATLEIALNNALDHHAEIGAKAGQYVQSERGATEKIYKYIF